MQSNVAIKVHDVHYWYPDGTLGLGGVSLQVSCGEKIAVLGPNGAGKSTLLLVIDGLLKPQRGYVEIFGERITPKNAPNFRKHMALVLQDSDDQLFCPTVGEDIAFGPRQLGLPEDEVQRRVLWVAKLLQIEDLLDKPPFRLSGGEKRRVALATALVMKPKILLVDEPTTNLDAEGVEVLIRTLNEFNRREKTTIVITTQDVDFIPYVADYLYLFSREKRIIAQGKTEDLMVDAQLLRSCGVKPPKIIEFFEELMLLGINMKSVPPTPREAAKAIYEKLKRKQC